MVLIDSSVWIDYFNGADTLECDALDALLGRELVLIGGSISCTPIVTSMPWSNAWVSASTARARARYRCSLDAVARSFVLAAESGGHLYSIWLVSFIFQPQRCVHCIEGFCDWIDT